ncbi:hypothetical protein Agabi119p4_7915 [Agaricus bisporus var. burnettii]|uniref:AMP-dependent synthetase/ligase domain-containing protein n=1 Tax=Agaricus bisporus var. burnettii TaxID=192524 RepID=A0A8H7C803_AGABI|nr:hypothetical protein Agabi119p4_7915 [Agaricus bisporus var. burnettii]
MYLKSPYPDLPEVPDANVYYTHFKRPDQAEWPDFTAFIDATTGQRRRYSEYVKRVEDLATALGTPVSEGGLGLRAGEGELVGIFSENCMDYITLVHSCLVMTTPFALISSYSTAFELRHALNLTKVTRLFVDAKLLPTLLPVAKEIGIPIDRIYLLLGDAPGFRSVSELVNHVTEKRIPFIGVQPAKKNTLAYLVLSSGTTGLPKAVMISHGNLSCAFMQFATVVKVGAEVMPPPTPKGLEGLPTQLAFLPLHHSYGLHQCCFRALIVPQTIVILKKWDIKTALDVVQRYKVSSLALVPSIVHQLVNYPGIEKADLSSVQSSGSGGAYLPPELSSKFSSIIPNANFMEGYGLSEGTIGAINQPFPGSLKGKLKIIPGSIGVLLPGIEARILLDDGTPVKVNEPGEFWFKGGNVALGYLNNDQADKETFVNGWLKTGDKFYVNEEGYLFFADRAKDTLKVSGIQVSPVEIENVLLAHPQKLITDVTVAGVSGGRTSDEKVPRAWIVLSPKGEQAGAQTVIKELDNWHKKNLSKYKWLRGGFEVVTEIPKSPTGKTLRRVLQDQYEGRLRANVKL